MPIRVGSIVKIDDEVVGKVLASSTTGKKGFGFLDYRVVGSRKKRFIGISPMGNPRVRVVKYGRGRILNIPDWRD